MSGIINVLIVNSVIIIKQRVIVSSCYGTVDLPGCLLFTSYMCRQTYIHSNDPPPWISLLILPPHQFKWWQSNNYNLFSHLQTTTKHAKQNNQSLE